MLKPNQWIKMNWNNSNRKHYIEKGYSFTKHGDAFYVRAEDLTRTSKKRVIIICDICKENEYNISQKAYTKATSSYHFCNDCLSMRTTLCSWCSGCGDKFLSTTMAYKKSESGKLFCSNACVSIYNAERYDRKVTKICEHCEEEYRVKRVYKDTAVTCSVKCQNEWQKTYWLVDDRALKKQIRISVKREWKRRYGDPETAPERMVREYLENLGFVNNIDFIQEKPILDRYFADFYFPEYNLILEVFGDYWHVNPDVYGEDKKPISETQKTFIERDNNRREDILKHDFNYIEVWEKDVYKDVGKALQYTLTKIRPVTTECQAPNN